MEKGTKRKIKNFTIDLIDFFLDLPEAVMNGLDRKEFYRLMSGYSTKRELSCSNIAQIIANFKRRGYIEIEKTDRGESIVFTNKATLAIVDKLSDKNRQDGKFRFVSFDIPESKRINRDQFRRAIKRMGFVQIQKSLWATNKNIGDFVDMAAKEYEVDEYVVYLVTKATNIDSFLNQTFTKKIENRYQIL